MAYNEESLAKIPFRRNKPYMQFFIWKITAVLLAWTTMLFSILYESVLILLALAAAPKLLYRRFVQGRYKESLAQKFGAGFPEIKKGKRKLIWVHAVSFGETRAVAPLVRLLKKELGDVLIVVSSTTETGHNEAVKSIHCADYHVYLPLDFSWIVRPIVKAVRPDLLLLTETDFWYNFLNASKQAGARVVLVNGKLSERSTRRLKYLRFFSGRLFSQIDYFCIQSEEYRRRFSKIGVSEKKITVTGNLKFDDAYPKAEEGELASWKEKLGIKKEDKILVIGSTHSPEEHDILKMLASVWEKNPELKVLLVPRHPERFDEVAGILKKRNLPFIRLSRPGKCTGNEKVVLVDAMGLLRQCYQLADIALVAGSFTPKVGGHNIIEPSWYGVPTLFGPHMHGQPELVRLVKQYGCGEQLSLPVLAERVDYFLNNPFARQNLGNAGKRLAEESRGAAEKTLGAILSIAS